MNRFTVDLPGQPPSWNRTYRIVRLPAKDKHGQPVLGADGTQKKYSTMKKTEAVADYQTMAGYLINTAKPSAFKPEGLIYVLYELFLGRDVDCDNVMKAIDDTLARCLEVNDNRFLPVAMSKETGVKDPHVKLTVLDHKHWAVVAVPL